MAERADLRERIGAGRERRPSTFRQRDITAAIKAVKAAGDEVVRVEVGKDGKIVIITARDQTREANEWDAVLP